jgi:replicative DNA helicase
MDSYELESSLIGSMLLDNKYFKRSQEDGLLPEDFENKVFKKAYEVMIKRQASDIVTVRAGIDEFQHDVINSAMQNCITAAGYTTWIKSMHDKTANNKLLRLAQEIPKIVSEDLDIKEKVDRVNSLVIENKVTKNVGAPIQVNEIFETVQEELENTKLIYRNLVRTGFTGIDDKIKGFKTGDLIVVAGRPGMGKTTWALNVATHNIHQGKNVLIFSLEMTNEQLLKKIVSSETSLSMDSLLTGNLTEKQWGEFAKAKEKYNDKGLYIYDRSPITIETLINKTKAIQAVTDIDLIVVDYLQLLMTSNKAPSNSDSRAASMSYISNLLKGLAKEIGCPLISLSQLNRGVEARTDKRPVLSDLRDSGSIEQDADMVIMLYRQEYYDALDTGLAEVIIRKNRMGMTGDFELHFDGVNSRFLDPEDMAFGRKKYGQI